MMVRGIPTTFCCHLGCFQGLQGKSERQECGRPSVELSLLPSCFKIMHGGLAFLEETTPRAGKGQKMT